MPSLLSTIGLVASVLAAQAYAACSSNLLIDNFSKSWSTHSNSLNSWTSDDGSMTSITSSGNTLKFKPGSGYFYETFSCQAAQTNGYNAITFSIKGPAGGSFVMEAQSKTSCSSSTYTSTWKGISGITGSTQTITVPLSDFAGIHINAVSAFVWSSFSSGSSNWELSNINFVCGGGSTSSAASTLTSSTRSSSSSSGQSSSVSSSIRSSTASSSVGSSSVSSSVSSSSTVSSTSSSFSPTASGGICPNYVIDDWASQSRLTFLYYNAMMQATSDDGTMKSLVVNGGNTMTLTPTNTNSYFYSRFTCVKSTNVYGGISLKMKAAAGTKINIQISSSESCGDDDKSSTQTSTQLGWTFDGTEKSYTIPFNKFSNINFDKLTSILVSGLTHPVTFGPMAFYCGNTPTYYTPTASSGPGDATSTVAAPTGTGAAFVIDSFANANSNALGFWHGGDDGMSLSYNGGKLTIKSTDADYAFYSQVSGSCKDMTTYSNSYLHIAYTGSVKFTIALQQHNSGCNANVAPYPETWDSIEAARYAKDGHIYIPINHFNINLGRVIGIALKGFYTSETVTLSKIEIVNSVPAGTSIPNKLPTGDLVFACKRPNSFAFAIDDGSPEYAQQVMNIIKAENIKVTFFTVGAPLEDPTTNLTNVYREMMAQGHQVALHSYTHPKMEGLPDYAAIDWEYDNDIRAVAQQLDGLHTPYFRPPFGNEGARMRQRLARSLGTDNPHIINWSVDVEDWLYAQSSTPEKQLDAFKRDIAKGGNLVVLHYLYPSTVGYLQQFIQLAKATGKDLMRVDQCMMDPNAPPL